MDMNVATNESSTNNPSGDEVTAADNVSNDNDKVSVNKPESTADPDQNLHEMSSDDVVVETQSYDEDTWLTKIPRKVADATEFKNTSGNFLKGCKWAPDGSCILTNSNDNILRIFNLSSDVDNKEENQPTAEMSSVLRMRDGELVYDYCWYPDMNSANPASCCLLSTSRDSPTHMWDAFDGHLRCSYRAFNHVDEIVAAHSLAFDLQRGSILCGFNKMVRVFDVSRPGKQCQQRPTLNKEGGQSGIISCIAVNEVSHMYAAASYSKQVGLYDSGDGSLCYLLQGQIGGITHLIFSTDGTKLYCGGRKDSEILCWDLRNPGKILFVLSRQVLTNQRIYFDISRCGNFLVSGNDNGTVSLWDLRSTDQSGVSEPVISPTKTFLAHHDVVNGVSFNPVLPLLATSSGQRHYHMTSMSDSEDEEGNAEANSREENSLTLWNFM